MTKLHNGCTMDGACCVLSVLYGVRCMVCNARYVLQYDSWCQTPAFVKGAIMSGLKCAMKSGLRSAMKGSRAPSTKLLLVRLLPLLLLERSHLHLPLPLQLQLQPPQPGGRDLQLQTRAQSEAAHTALLQRGPPLLGKVSQRGHMRLPRSFIPLCR